MCAVLRSHVPGSHNICFLHVWKNHRVIYILHKLATSLSISCLPSDIPPSGEPVSKSNRSRVTTRFPKLSRNHQRETRNLEPQSGDLWPFFITVNTGTMYFKSFCDSFLARIYNWSSWRDYSCINLNPEKRHSFLRVISWLTTLEGGNHFLKRLRGLFTRAQQTNRHFLCFVKLHCTYSLLFFCCYEFLVHIVFLSTCTFSCSRETWVPCQDFFFFFPLK